MGLTVRVILIVLMAYYTTSFIQIIDDFKPNALPVSVQNLIITDATTRFRSSTGPAVLGSERESIVTILPGTSNTEISTSINEGQWKNTFPVGTTGWSILQYDGTDGASALSLSPGITNDGSALDLTYGNSAYAFYFRVIGNAYCDYQFNVYGASKTEVSTYTFEYNPFFWDPEHPEDPQLILIPFAIFDGTASFNNVHAIELILNVTYDFVPLMSASYLDTTVSGFGVFGCEVKGTVYADCDQNGVDNGENPIVGAIVTATNYNIFVGDTPVSSTQLSNVNGTFDFRGLSGGRYTVCVSNTITNTNPTVPSTGCISVDFDDFQNIVETPNFFFGFAGRDQTSIFPPVDQTVQCGSCTTTACLGEPTYASCESSVPTITSQDVTTGSCPTIITRTFSATGVSSATQTITVVDTTAPTIVTRASYVTVPCSNQNPTLTNWVNSNAGFTASDCNSITYTNTWNQQQITNNCGGSAAVVFTAIDSCGNSASSGAIYTITDNVTPVFTKLPTNNSTACDIKLNSDLTAFNNWLNKRGYATATDDCTAVADLVWSNNNVGVISQSCNAVKTVTFTVADKCGNSNSATATFTVTDISRPTFTSPAKSLTVLCSTDFNTSFNNWLNSRGGATATDNCTPASSLVYSNNYSGAALTGCGKQIAVTFYATDACGNRSAGTTATFTYKK